MNYASDWSEYDTVTPGRSLAGIFVLCLVIGFAIAGIEFRHAEDSHAISEELQRLYEELATECDSSATEPGNLDTGPNSSYSNGRCKGAPRDC